MHIFHCWHEIEGTVRKIPYNTKCKIIEQPQFIHNGKYINCSIKVKCCICGKEKLIYFRDYEIQRASLFKMKEI